MNYNILPFHFLKHEKMDTLAKFSRDAVNFFKSLFEEDQEQKYQ